MSESITQIVRIWWQIHQLRFKYSARTRELFSRAIFLIGLAVLPVSRSVAAGFLMRSHRNTNRRKRILRIEKILKGFDLLRPDIMELHVPRPAVSIKQLSPSWTMIIKERTADEKGVLLFKFSDVFTIMRQLCSLERILQDYYLVLEPSHAGYCNPEILQYLAYRDHRIIVESSEPLDFEFLSRLDSNLVPAKFGASDWIDDRVFKPLSLEKVYDCVMVAAWNPVKRHASLLRAVGKLKDCSYKVALAGGALGLTQEDIRNMASYYAVSKNVTYFERISQDEVNVLLNKSKCNVLLSVKEGSNKSIFEGFFADVPGIVLKENLGVNKSYINEQTGLLVKESELCDALVAMREKYSTFSPRRWAIENIACQVTTRKLELLLAQFASACGQKWTRPLIVKTNAGSFPHYYLDDKKELRFDLESYLVGAH